MFENFIIKYWEAGRIKIESLALNRVGALTPGDCRWWKFKVKVSTHFVKEESVSPAGAKDQRRGENAGQTQEEGEGTAQT